MKRLLTLVTIVLLIANSAFGVPGEKEDIKIVEWTNIGQLQNISGLNGAFAGVSNNLLILSGGTTADKDNSNKFIFHDEIYVVSKHPDGSVAVKEIGKLSKSLAFGAAVSTDMGVVCLGGQNHTGSHRDVSILKYNEQTGQIEQVSLPDLPAGVADFGATILNETIYVAGGVTDSAQNSAGNNFWSYDLSKQPEAKWQSIAPWPGPKRSKCLVVTQFNGKADCIYIMAGQSDNNGNVQYLTDVYEFTPNTADNAKNSPWRKCSDMPVALAGVKGFCMGQSHIFAFGQEISANNDRTFLYHTITDTWVPGRETPQHFASSTAIDWDGSMMILGVSDAASGASMEIWQVEPLSRSKSFGIINFSVIGLYLAMLIGVGVFFSFRQKNTDDYFRGGQRIPWFVAGCSIFATMLSSLTFIAIPAKAFMTDWSFFIINMFIVAVAPFIIYCILPFFRNINVVSAYEYLEKRFNLFVRLFASTSFIFYHIGRMAIVLYLTALPIAAITHLSVHWCILIIGGLSIIYCTMGGLEAVVWTDTIQTFVLLGGAMLSLAIIIMSIKGGPGEFFSIAASSDKFRMVTLDFSLTSYTKAVLWVIIIGGIGNSVVPYVSDMSIVQRYMSVPDKKRSQKAIWTNAIACIPASIIFFGLGTALFVFYKTHPSLLDPTFKNDAIFPLFIVRQLPVGVAGLIVAGVFAAAQSTISTSMNSTSVAFVTDFVRRFDMIKSDHGYLNLARLMTIIFGASGSLLGLVFASSDIQSMFETAIGVLGLLGGAMCGLFLLGMFTKRANGFGAAIGALAGIAVVAAVKVLTPTSQLLYACIAILTTVVIGYLTSQIVPKQPKNIKGLTWFSLK